MDTYRMPEANGTQPLATEHLNLRPFKTRDASGLSACTGDSETLRFFASPALDIPNAESDIRSARMQYGDPSFFHWCIADLSDKCTGLIDASLNASSSSAEVSYIIAPDSRGRGYAAEALKAVISYLHEACRVHRITAKIDADNPASIRTAERAGMELEGVHQDALVDRFGNYRDIAVFAHIGD